MLLQSDLDLHCLLKRFLNVSADNKNIQLFVICALRVDTGQCKCGQDFHARTFARLKKLIYSLLNYK